MMVRVIGRVFLHNLRMSLPRPGQWRFWSGCLPRTTPTPVGFDGALVARTLLVDEFRGRFASTRDGDRVGSRALGWPDWRLGRGSAWRGNERLTVLLRLESFFVARFGCSWSSQIASRWNALPERGSDSRVESHFHFYQILLHLLWVIEPV